MAVNIYSLVLAILCNCGKSFQLEILKNIYYANLNSSASVFGATCPDYYPMAFAQGQLCCSKLFRSQSCPNQATLSWENDLQVDDPEECCDGEAIPCTGDGCTSQGTLESCHDLSSVPNTAVNESHETKILC